MPKKNEHKLPYIIKNKEGKYIDIVIYRTNGREFHLNEKFANDNKLSYRNICNLQELYNKLFELKDELNKIDRDLSKIKRLGSRAQSIEFAIQRQWRFSEDEKRHVYNFRLRHCSCSSDVGYSKNCTLHGDGISLDT